MGVGVWGVGGMQVDKLIYDKQWLVLNTWPSDAIKENGTGEVKGGGCFQRSPKIVS